MLRILSFSSAPGLATEYHQRKMAAQGYRYHCSSTPVFEATLMWAFCLFGVKFSLLLKLFCSFKKKLLTLFFFFPLRNHLSSSLQRKQCLSSITPERCLYPEEPSSEKAFHPGPACSRDPALSSLLGPHLSPQFVRIFFFVRAECSPIVCIYQFVYPFFHWWSLGLLSHVSCCK